MKNTIKLQRTLILLAAVCGILTSCSILSAIVESGNGGGERGPGGGYVFANTGTGGMECSGDLGVATWSNAITIAQSYNGGGFTDWRLPTKEELNLMYENLRAKGLGGFEQSWYWSSSEYDINNTSGDWRRPHDKHGVSPDNRAWFQNFRNGDQDHADKDITIRAVAVRSF